jgi:hypothetical protein
MTNAEVIYSTDYSKKKTDYGCTWNDPTGLFPPQFPIPFSHTHVVKSPPF